MNKNPVKFGIILVVVGAAFTGYGLLVKMSHDSCLERERQSGLALCAADASATFFLVGLPVIGIGILVLVLGIRDAPILERVFGRSE